MRQLSSVRWLGLGTLAALTLLASPRFVRAQDSVGGVLNGKCGGSSGLACNDAQDAFDGSTRQSYVVDLGQYPTTWGNWYGYAPISKATRNQDPLFANDLISAQSASRRLVTVGSPASASYGLWNTQGHGIANPSSTVSPPAGNLYRFGAVAADFGGSANNIVSETVEVSTKNYNRLYVTRHESAVGQASNGTGGTASMGIGSVDPNGNPRFRADNAVSGTPGAKVITNLNLLSVDNSLRTAGVVNSIINSNGVNTGRDSAATSFDLINAVTTVNHVPPATLDSAGFAPLSMTGNFNREYAYGDGSPPGLVVTTTHRPGTDDHRGAIGFTHTYKALGNGVSDAGTAAVLSQPTGAGATTGISVFGVNGDGSVDGTVLLTLPPGITDPTDGFTPGSIFPNTPVFDHYRSQVAFAGGTGQVALAGDRNDPNVLYAAATVYFSGTGAQDPYNLIAVCKYDKSNGSQTWTIAAYNAIANSVPTCTEPGKRVLDGPGGTPVGVILPLYAVTGSNPIGPSISPPMLDTEGNVYFMAAWEHFLDTDSNGSCDAVDPDSGLFKAHRLANGGYELEGIISLGSTIYGPNSDTRYSLRFMGVADSNSVASGTVWSGNIVQDRLPGTLVNSLDTFDMGGFVVNISVTYDVDKDGDYQRPTGASPDDPTSADEAYEQLIYVRGVVRTGACCAANGSCTDVTEAACTSGTFQGFGTTCEFAECVPQLPPCVDADVNCDGAVNGSDILSVRAPGTWNTASTGRADVNNDGQVNGSDILSIRAPGTWNTSTGPCICGP